MKRIFIAALSTVVTLNVMAEGYQVNTLSTRQLGMGHTGTAMKLGSESMIFNPGALGFQTSTIDVSGSFTAIKASATCTYQDKEYHTDNGFSTPMSVNASFKIYDNLYAGVSFYTPYGSGINWTKNWPGAELSQKVALKVYTVQPTVSWRIFDKVSVGAGVMLAWGSVNLDKALVSGKSFDALVTPMGLPVSLGDAAAASINLTGKSDLSVGANVGVLYDINPKWNVGVNFRSKMDMKVGAGVASVSYANEVARQVLEQKLGAIHESNFKSSMPCPYVLNVGASYKPTAKLLLAADIQLTGWKTYDQLYVEFPQPLTPLSPPIEKNYKNSLTYHVGAQYSVTSRTDLRAGLMVDTSPVDADRYNPETPGMTKIEPTVGVSFRPIPNLSVDFAFMYVAGLGADNRSCTYKDMVTGASKTFTANYSAHAFNPSIGLSYSF